MTAELLQNPTFLCNFAPRSDPIELGLNGREFFHLITITLIMNGSRAVKYRQVEFVVLFNMVCVHRHLMSCKNQHLEA